MFTVQGCFPQVVVYVWYARIKMPLNCLYGLYGHTHHMVAETDCE